MLRVLTQKYEFDHGTATQIADAVAPTGSIRDAEHVGGLWKEDPELGKAQAERLQKR